MHDISTAKQWERPSSIDDNFKVPEGIEDPSDDEDGDKAEQTGPSAKKPRTGPASPVPANVDDDTSKTNMEQCSTRRVTLSLNNEIAEDQPVSSTQFLPQANDNPTNEDPALTPESTKDRDKMLWVDTQSRFNQRGESNPEKEVDILVKTSVSPKEAHQTADDAKRTNKSPALNLEQFAFGNGDTGTQTPKQQTVSLEECMAGVKSKGSILKTKSGTKGISADTNCYDVGSPEIDTSGLSEPSPGTVVWEGFDGTDVVVAMAKLERERARERKLHLEQCRHIENEVTENVKISLSKGDFSKMTILGQFNLGFILATDSRCNLWILDQHACDERANFEHLMANTIIHNQQLIAPMPLELDPSEENCIRDNMHIFEANGFRFQYNEDKPPRYRMALTALPHSGARDGRKAVNFGKEDVSALCAILGARSGSVFEEDGLHYDGGTGADGSGSYGNNAVRRYAGASQTTATADDADKVITRLPKAIAMVCLLKRKSLSID